MIQLISGLLAVLFALPVPVESVDELLLNSSYTVSTADSTGTAFVIESGLLLTAAHVVEGATKVKLQATPPSTETASAEVVYRDDVADIAILDPFTDLAGQPLTFNFNPPVHGETVYTVGSALGAGTLSRGSIDTSITQSDRVVARLPIDSGYSGGALVDNAGQILGLVVEKDTETEGIAYSVPTSILQSALEKYYASAGIVAPTSESPTSSASSADGDAASEGMEVDNTWVALVSVFALIVLVTVLVVVMRGTRRGQIATSNDKIIINLDN